MPKTVDDPRLHQSQNGARLEASSREGRRQAKEAYGDYHRWQRLRRLALVAFLVMAVLFFLWVIPWLPSGLDTNDYTPELAFTIYLLGGVAVTGILAFAFQERARRQSESMVMWASVYEESTGLHSRTYLYDRLMLECERARRGGTVFSILVMRFQSGNERPPLLSEGVLEDSAVVINRLTHSTDLVARLGGSELALLATGTAGKDCEPLHQRLGHALRAEVLRFLDGAEATEVRGGSATYGVDGTEAGALVQAARTQAMATKPAQAAVA